MFYRFPFIVFFFFSCIILSAQTPSIELRGVWVASIANIDWPSKKGLSEKQQKQEIINLLEYYKKLNFNAVFVQVRPSADVFYKSKFEPWSRYITGEQGKKPGYDPLKFWIKESHKRNIEFHAWINPFRITQSASEQIIDKHPAKQNSNWTFNYGGKLYYNPGVPEVRRFIGNVVTEIVNKYEVDGIHFDDYFYPYPIAGEELPDAESYKRYNVRKLSIEDWRRQNVNEIIKDLGNIIKTESPNVKFGISPFGVWRNKDKDERGSATRAGVTNYDDLYADVLLWLEKDWIDYITPQVYWSDENKAVPYNYLVNWWAQNSFGKDVYVGHALYKVDSKDGAWRNPSEIPNQVKKTRNTEGIKGSVFFRHKFFSQNSLGVSDSLSVQYKYPALLPVCINTPNKRVATPNKLNISRNGKIKWKCKDKSSVKYYALYTIKEGGVRQLKLINSEKKALLNSLLKDENGVVGIQITAIDNVNRESKGSDIYYL
ncbi:glycoside hydrolase family 10 protein [Saccharicrinis aurantiacus]|uniref:glycoside hydrolase family 10 protein n=1 Tax=Saccharicrinis aurantiacus TaxID=1849719 RepID=UPI0024900676|nr:family 10 glycosylhydrolase [Saccharicrinis aurantiacus]